MTKASPSRIGMSRLATGVSLLAHHGRKRPERQRDEDCIKEYQHREQRLGERQVRLGREDRGGTLHAAHERRQRDRVENDRQQDVTRFGPAEYRREQCADRDEPDGTGREERNEESWRAGERR